MKKKSELLIELAKFFKQELEPALIIYEKERKADVLPYMFVKALYIGFVSIFIFGFSGLTFLMPVVFLVILISVIYLSANKQFSKINRHKIIEMDYEMKLKRELMPKFLSLFDSGLKWYKYNDVTLKTCNKVLTYNPDEKNVTQKQLVQFFSKCSNDINNLEIFPKSNLMTLDDIIIGHELNVPIDIIETKFGLNLRNIFKYCASECTIQKLFFLLYFGSFIIFLILFFVFLFAPSWVIFLLVILLFTSPVLFIISVFISLKIKLAHSRSLLIQLKIKKPIKGHTVVFEKNHVFHTKKRQFEQVILENVNFENKYNTYSTDQIEARYLLTTAFISRFEDMKTAFTAKKIRAEFKDDKLSIFIEVDKDMFQMGNITQETTFKTFSTMLDEIYSVLTLAEQLNLDSETRL